MSHTYINFYFHCINSLCLFTASVMVVCRTCLILLCRNSKLLLMVWIWWWTRQLFFLHQQLLYKRWRFSFRIATYLWQVFFISILYYYDKCSFGSWWLCQLMSPLSKDEIQTIFTLFHANRKINLITMLSIKSNDV